MVMMVVKSLDTWPFSLSYLATPLQLPGRHSSAAWPPIPTHLSATPHLANQTGSGPLKPESVGHINRSAAGRNQLRTIETGSVS